MRVTVKLFARLRDLAGTSDRDTEVPPGATIGDVWNETVRAHAALAPYAASMSCARNFEYARLSTKVEDGDEIAFLPPVSGG
jgi:molybdopterin converting factor subunit 1